MTKKLIAVVLIAVVFGLSFTATTANAATCTHSSASTVLINSTSSDYQHQYTTIIYNANGTVQKIINGTCTVKVTTNSYMTYCSKCGYQLNTFSNTITSHSSCGQ